MILTRGAVLALMVGAASMGDRAQVVFSEPGEISRFIRTKCE